MRGLFIFSNNMEDVESLGTRALLIRSGLEIVTTTLNPTNEITTSFDQRIFTDTIFEAINPDDYDFLIIPGGPYVKQTVDLDQTIKALARSFDDKGKIIAAICAGPRFLGQEGLLDGKDYTAFTGSEKDAPKGRYHPKNKAMKDGNIITASGAGAIYEFSYEIVKTLQGQDKAEALLKQILH